MVCLCNVSAIVSTAVAEITTTMECIKDYQKLIIFTYWTHSSLLMLLSIVTLVRGFTTMRYINRLFTYLLSSGETLMSKNCKFA